MRPWAWWSFFIGLFVGCVLALLAVLGIVCLLVHWKHKDGSSGISD
jgi:hypothetical protein